jgi:hypothetical protein
VIDRFSASYFSASYFSASHFSASCFSASYFSASYFYDYFHVSAFITILNVKKITYIQCITKRSITTKLIHIEVAM